jgi:hypothetical protein
MEKFSALGYDDEVFARGLRMDRRTFLKLLIGLGAAVVLPTRPTEEQVEEAWDALVRYPFLFDVDEYGTIVEPGVVEPQIRSDIYDIDPMTICDPDSLVNAVEQYPELVSHFAALVASEVEEAQRHINPNDPSADGSASPMGVVELIKTSEVDWSDWVRARGREGLPAYRHEIAEWLSAPVDWDAVEWWPSNWSGQGTALEFFQSMENETLDALGVVIIEGEHPASSYFAAELRASIPHANAMAAVMALPFRFVAAAA